MTDSPKLDAHNLYLLTCLQALRDGVVEPAEEAVLNSLATYVGLSASQAAEVRAHAKEHFDAGMLVEGGPLEPEVAFQATCELALADGELDIREEELLDLAREAFKLDARVALRILGDVQG